MEAKIVKMETKYEEMKDEMDSRIQKLEEKKEKEEKKVKEINVHLEKKICELTEQLEEYARTVKSQINTVQSEIPTAVSRAMRDLPYLLVCAFQSGWYEGYSTISYDSILSEDNNGDQEGGADGKMDINSGTFTSLYPGYYSVTVSGYVYMKGGKQASIYIYRNGEKVEESLWTTTMGSGQQTMYDQGSRTVILYLGVDETVHVGTASFTASGFYDVVLCITLLGW